jgi:hypothetical protein
MEPLINHLITKAYVIYDYKNKDDIAYSIAIDNQNRILVAG